MTGDRYVPMTYFQSLEDARLTLREESLLALEKQIDYLEWLKTGHAPDFFEDFLSVYGGGAGTTRHPSMGDILRRSVSDLLGNAPTYYVSRDMTEMIKMAAEDVPRDGVAPADMLTGSGFLYFHHPIDVVGPAGDADTLNDPRNAGPEGGNYGTVGKTETVGIRAIAWEQTDAIWSKGRQSPGVAYYLFSDLDYFVKGDLERQGNEYIEAARAAGQDVPEPIEHVVPAEVLSERMRYWKARLGPVVLYDYSGWAYGRPWEAVPYDEPARPDDEVQGVHPVVDQARRLLLSTWVMLNQKVVSLSPARPPRAMRRRAGRVMPETGDVVVIRLRKEYHPEGSEEQAMANRAAGDDEPWFNHRFLVRGHWRRQPYGEGKSETKLIWIAPHVRGPDDRPLILKSKIWSLEH